MLRCSQTKKWRRFGSIENEIRRRRRRGKNCALRAKNRRRRRRRCCRSKSRSRSSNQRWSQKKPEEAWRRRSQEKPEEASLTPFALLASLACANKFASQRASSLQLLHTNENGARRREAEEKKKIQLSFSLFLSLHSWPSLWTRRCFCCCFCCLFSWS